MGNNLTRRNFVLGSAAAAIVAGLAACGGTEQQDTSSVPQKGNGYTESQTEDGWTLVDNGDGKQLGYSPDSGLKLIEKDGYAFKDFEGTGELVPYEDWRLSAEERAEDLAQRLSIEKIAGLMCFSMHQMALEDDASVTDDQKGFLDGGVRAVLNAAASYPAFKQATWANNMQAYVEGSDNKLPINFSSDPRPGNNAADWPGNLALAARLTPRSPVRPPVARPRTSAAWA
jgi:beta-glucosidase